MKDVFRNITNAHFDMCSSRRFQYCSHGEYTEGRASCTVRFHEHQRQFKACVRYERVCSDANSAIYSL